MKISAVVLTKNSAAKLGDCLPSLDWCQEIIVIDDFSTDNTVEVAKKFTYKIYEHHLHHDFASQRNFGLNKTANDWVLFVDSDEVVPRALAAEIVKKVNGPAINGYRLKRQDYFMGKKLRFGETSQVKLLRLARKSTGKWVRPVHEIWQVKGRVGELDNPLEHFPHPKLNEFLAEVNNYSDIEANFRLEKARLLRVFLELILFPPAKFIYNYVFCLGFLDGLPGLVMASVMSYHSILVRLKLIYKLICH